MVTYKNALVLFQHEESGEDCHYIAEIKSVKWFDMLVSCIALGMFFWMGIHMLQLVGTRLGGCNKKIAAGYTRIICATSLQML
jgi:hypothetical protein